MKIKNITLLHKRSNCSNAISLHTGGSFTLSELEIDLNKSNLIQDYLDNCEKIYDSAIRKMKETDSKLNESEWYLLKFEY